ncbi:MAG: type II secretion system F family protein [bacterium]
MPSSSGATNPPRKAWSVDLFELPGIRHWVARWRKLILANSACRREAKAVLFAELAEATARKMPLDVALSLSSQNLEEASERSRHGIPGGADSRHWIWDYSIGVFLFIYGSVLYLLLAFRFVDVERIARLLALRLHEHVARGLPLSRAMSLCYPDYADQEIRIVEAGERWGTLPQALKRLSQFQMTESRLTMQGAQALYPFLMGYFLFSIVAFYLITIAPKFEEIFRQIGARSLPNTTQFVIDVSYLLTRNGGVLIIASVLLVMFFIVRSLMNGNKIAPLFLSMTPVAFVPIVAAVPFIEHGHSDQYPGLALIASFVLFVFFLVLAPFYLHLIEHMILWIERSFAPLVRYMPVVGKAARAESEARWLAALSVALDSGVAPAEAVETAGRICGGKFEKRSSLAARAVAQGHPIGQACIAARVLRSQTNHRLALLDERSATYLDGLKAIAEDSADDAADTLNRSGRTLEVVSLLLLALVVGISIVAMYLPLFTIPGIIGPAH